MENNKPSYEEACVTLKDIIDVKFPTEENITHAFIKKEILPHITIGGAYSQEIKSALCVVLGEAMKKYQGGEIIVSNDNTDHQLLNHHINNKVISPRKEETVMKEKIEIITPTEKKKTSIELLTKKEKVIVNPDTKVWEDNIRVIKGTDYTDEKRKIALTIIHDLIKNYIGKDDIGKDDIGKDDYTLFIENYTKPDPQNGDNIVYRIQSIRADMLKKNHQKTPLQKIVKKMEEELNIE